MTNSYHDAYVLPAVRSAVMGITLKNWGLNRCAFDEKVLEEAQRFVGRMTDEEFSQLKRIFQGCRRSACIIACTLAKRGAADERIPYLILAMYFAKMNEKNLSSIPPRKLQEAP
jgi:hypothetical protein